MPRDTSFSTCCYSLMVHYEYLYCWVCLPRYLRGAFCQASSNSLNVISTGYSLVVRLKGNYFISCCGNCTISDNWHFQSAFRNMNEILEPTDWSNSNINFAKQPTSWTLLYGYHSERYMSELDLIWHVWLVGNYHDIWMHLSLASSMIY